MNNVLTRLAVSLAGFGLVIYGIILKYSNPIVECPGHDASIFGLMLCALYWIMRAYSLDDKNEL